MNQDAKLKKNFSTELGKFANITTGLPTIIKGRITSLHSYSNGVHPLSLFTRMIRELDFLRFASPGGRAVTALGDALDQYFEGSKIAQVVSSVYGGSFGIVMSWIPSFFTTAGIDNDSMEALFAIPRMRYPRGSSFANVARVYSALKHSMKTLGMVKMLTWGCGCLTTAEKLGM